ncbi:hypothetical protein Ahy_A09g041444 isoform C [Arachis hypogaea]|uniref:Protein kinase domain-containing protein n=1 Tax=Arachis hypogaea TaxID=3818 RepID=A0A445BCX5_ARAHY|nr:hypothetical protein Ahy_A09g041444 isoform C [Arachis hypogaea]
MYRRLCALSRRCRQLELAAELLHHLQAVASPLISSLSLLNTIVVSSVTSKSLIKQSRNRINVIRRKRNSAKKFLKQDTIDLLANHLQAVHLIQGINEQKARFIVSFVAAMPSGSLATTRKVSTWPPFSQRIKQTVMLHFYSANLMRDASLNDRVELRILGDVGAKILVINFDTPGVQTIFDNILNRKIPWPAVPEEMSPEAQDLIDRLLTEDPNQRLGARGASEVI